MEYRTTVHGVRLKVHGVRLKVHGVRLKVHGRLLSQWDAHCAVRRAP
jgi:hypothetical protein